MAYRVFWTPLAVQDLRDICDFIARGNPAAAQRMGGALIAQAETTALFPQSGRVVPEKKDPLIRETIVGAYRVIYRIDEANKILAIARVWHSARGTPPL
jgi:toxin ParE1/3/4